MLTFVNHAHLQYTPTHEYFRGELVPAFEKSARLESVLAELAQVPNSPLGEVHSVPDEVLLQVHTARYIHFLQHFWHNLEAARGQAVAGSVFPSVWPITRPSMPFRSDLEPSNPIAALGLYSFDNGTPFTAGSWAAAKAGADAAYSAALAVGKGQVPYSFVATRPPGHHAGADFMGGYCFINNAAIAAQTLRNQGAKRVAILDVDYHHGNGSQDIFYHRSDVMVVNIHADPSTDYPFYIGHADETGRGEGLGYTLNLPLPQHTPAHTWFANLNTAVSAIQSKGCDALVVSLGVDTYAHDPICSFQLNHDDYVHMGQVLAALKLPTVVVLEGGYAVDAIGKNVAAVLKQFS